MCKQGWPLIEKTQINVHSTSTFTEGRSKMVKTQINHLVGRRHVRRVRSGWKAGGKRGVLVFHEKVVEPTSPKRDAFKAVPIETNSITQKAIQMESPTLL